MSCKTKHCVENVQFLDKNWQYPKFCAYLPFPVGRWKLFRGFFLKTYQDLTGRGC